MRFLSLATCALLFAFAATPDLSAQVAPIAGTGCQPGGGTPGTPFSVGGLPPRINTPNFAIGHNPPAFGTVACFWLIGLCSTAPRPDYPASLNCGVPCANAINLASPPLLGGANVPPSTVTTALPLPNAPGIVGVTVCVQYLCFGGSFCSEISQGVAITIMP